MDSTGDKPTIQPSPDTNQMDFKNCVEQTQGSSSPFPIDQVTLPYQLDGFMIAVLLFLTKEEREKFDVVMQTRFDGKFGEDFLQMFNRFGSYLDDLKRRYLTTSRTTIVDVTDEQGDKEKILFQPTKKVKTYMSTD